MRFAIPVIVLIGLLALLGFGLRQDPREVPSPLIGKAAPAFELPNLEGTAKLTPQDLKGRPVLVNFFASWCAGCQVEHPVLMQLAHEYNIEIVGMDYKDTREDAQAWLARHGQPYRSVIADQQGSAGLDWGVYGVPETFVLGADGRILYKQIGPMTIEAWREHIAPLMAGAS
ncbi:DsbE family thiol:disulfide interchange protein [Hydrocarboniphaga sp.]|uniref:DsbE family thiol:disulfide interchange protein n=1 Tax=Hydrocarboniphaga sp. TaxID=2033016 RepID=UPI003D0EF9CC